MEKSTTHGILFICLLSACIKGYNAYLDNQNKERLINYMEKRDSVRLDSILKKDMQKRLHINVQSMLKDSIY